MNFDLPLLLVVLSLIGSVIWLVDRILWRPVYLERVEKLKEQLPSWDQPEHKDAKLFADMEKQLPGQQLWVRETKAFLPIILLVLIIRSFLYEPFQIPSASMEPGLVDGDFILVDKFSYGIRLPVLGTKIIDTGEPQRGDVMVFFPPHRDDYFIKRVIGLPGDVIEYRDHRLFVNGEEQLQTEVVDSPMDFQNRTMYTEQLEGGKVHRLYNKNYLKREPFSITVLPGHYFMMGDNRDNSSDSREWGLVPEENIVGKAIVRWMYWKEWTSLPSFSRVGTIE